MANQLTLVLGGARAGKSSYAQRLAAQGERVLFVATAEAGDDEMKARIEAHKLDRPAGWDTLEEPIDLSTALDPVVDSYDTVLIDCMTLWASNLLIAGQDIPAKVQGILELYQKGTASWILVSNEVGLGVVPPTEIGRAYADELGRLNQMVAAAADVVVLIVAGLSVNVKEIPS